MKRIQIDPFKIFRRFIPLNLSNRLLVLVSLFIFFSSGPSALSKDMQGRLGLGYNAEFENFKLSNGVPAISIKYGLTRDLATEVLFGISTASPSNSISGLKFFKNIFYENNLNFYFMLGGALVSGNGTSGSEFLGGFGVEFFIPGVDSLGFSMETGASFDNISGSFVFKTLGVSFLNAGMHFYF